MSRSKEGEDRDSYARMTNEQKQEKLKRRREAYQQSKTIKDLTQLHKKCTRGRKKYADLNPKEKTKEMHARKAEICKYAARTEKS